LTVLCGLKEAGKTTLAMNFAEHAAVEQKRPVLYLVQTFSAQTLFGQIASSRARVGWLDVAEGKLGAKEREQFEHSAREIAASPLTIDDTPRLEDGELVERIETWARSHPSGLAIVDHVRRDSHRDVDRCSQTLKSAAVRTGAAIVGTAWATKYSYDRERIEDGVGVSHADFTWTVCRLWGSSRDNFSRDEGFMSIADERTKEHQLFLSTKLDEKCRRFHVIAGGSFFQSLGQARSYRQSWRQPAILEE
jgi:hypothetical protein